MTEADGRKGSDRRRESGSGLQAAFGGRAALAVSSNPEFKPCLTSKSGGAGEQEMRLRWLPQVLCRTAFDSIPVHLQNGQYQA